MLSTRWALALLPLLSCGPGSELQTTPSGLAYEVLEPGQPGPRPQLNDLVVVHFTARLENGTEVESTRGRQPARFRLGDRGIEGLTEGLQLMQRGARLRLVVPPELGHGERGARAIPPGATLTYEVELLDFQPGPRPPSFRPADPTRQETTESGLVYEVLVEGEGPTIGPDDSFVMNFACWNEDGRLLHWSGISEPFRGTLQGFELPFLREAVPLMRRGALLRFEVPPEIGLEEEGQTVWEIQVASVEEPPEDLPRFREPDPATLTRTESGLLYRVEAEGSGDRPGRDSRCRLHIAGWLEDGSLIEATYLRGEPATVRPRDLMQGLREGLGLMPAGSTYTFVVPPELAYGAAGNPPRVPGNATLIFRLELLDVLEGS